MIPFLLFYTLPSEATEKEERSWQDEIIYSIMVDRFFNGTFENDFKVNVDDPYAYHGGDINGIIKKLDYIKELGFTTILITPIMDNQADGYHGFWITDFNKVEEHFGTVEDAKQLVKEAHNRDMKVIFDFVVNHTGDKHPWLDDPAKSDWYHEKQEMTGDSQEMLENAWVADLPDLAQENPEVKQYLLNSAQFWIQETGVDGFRLDKVKHVPTGFWEDFTAHIKSIDEDFFILGEVTSADPRYISEYNKTGIDGFDNYPLYKTATEIFSAPGNSLKELNTILEQNKRFYDNPLQLGNYIDNYDTKRFTRVALESEQNPVTRWKLALTYMYTAPGFPIIYQGSEIPMDGGNNPDNRHMMNFKAGDQEIEQHFKKLAAIRKEFPALTRGDFQQVVDKQAFAVYKRSYQDQTVYIVINNDIVQHNATLEGIAEGKQLRGLIHDDIVRRQSDGTYKFALNRETSEVYIIEADVGINGWFVAMIVTIMGLFVGSVIYLSRKNKQAVKE